MKTPSPNANSQFFSSRKDKASIGNSFPLMDGIREFLTLMGKARKVSLTEEEQVQLHAYQQDVVKVIPILILFLLPGSFLTLPLVFMIVPRKRLIPASFMKQTICANSHNIAPATRA